MPTFTVGPGSNQGNTPIPELCRERPPWRTLGTAFPNARNATEGVPYRALRQPPECYPNPG
jgi:hypothetical protein